MFHFWKNNIGDLSNLGVDIHSHILPGIDDGCKDLAASIETRGIITDLGIERMIYTPHIHHEYYPNSGSSIKHAYEQLMSNLTYKEAYGHDTYAAEYMLDDNFHQQLKNEVPFLCLKDKYLLIELPIAFENPQTQLIIFELFIAGYQVIIAHPERYLYYENRLAVFQQLKNMGCLFQLNLLSMSEYYGKNVSQLAIQLLKKGWYDFAATDIHNATQHTDILKVLASKNWNKWKNYPFKNSIFA
jgi:tyrosine-protein phosphatase YwqE